MKTVLALDFGGTKLAAAGIDLPSGKILSHERQATPAGRGAEASLQAMIRLGRAAVARSGQPVQAVGVSFGGPLSADRRTVLRSMHVAEWDGFPLAARLSAAFGLPAVMDNDGNAAALGEWRYGAGRGCDRLLYVQVSTGIGAGLVLDGQVYRGGGLAGEFGHLTVQPSRLYPEMQPGGPTCSCGKRGCVEALASGWALARDGRAALADEAADAKAVLDACRAGDARAAQVVDQAFYYLGVALSQAIVLLDPQAVVLGGGVARAWDVLQPRLEAALDEHLPPTFHGRFRLEHSLLDGMETLLGAALLAAGLFPETSPTSYTEYTDWTDDADKNGSPAG